MGRYLILVMLVVAIGLVGYQIYSSSINYKNFEKEVKAIQEEVGALTKENVKLAKEIEFLGKSENLIKEIKSRFNYRFPEERTIIVAP